MKTRQTGSSPTEGQGMSVWSMEAKQMNALVAGERTKHQEQQLLQQILLQQRVKSWLDGVLGRPHRVGDS